MRFLKDMVQRKFELFYIEQKNNRFNPSLFFEVVSLVNSYFDELTLEQIKIRKILLYTYNWSKFNQAFRSLKKIDFSLIENKTQVNQIVKSKYSVLVMPCVEEINKIMMEDYKMLNRFFNKFKIKMRRRRIEVSYPDINSKWSIGIVKDRLGDRF